jgi:hypothetical protein
VAAFLLYASHALEGDIEKANSCLSDFVERVIELASASDPGGPLLDYRFDGFVDSVVNSSASQATKLVLLVVIDLQKGQLVTPSSAKVPEFAPLIQRLASPPQVAVL